MNVYAINGGLRRGFYTDKLLETFLSGAASIGPEVETKLVHLYEIDDREHSDDMGELLQKIFQADVVAFASPIFVHGVSDYLYNFLARLTSNAGSDLTKQVQTAFLYTMNVTPAEMLQCRYPQSLAAIHQETERLFGRPPEMLCAYGTYQDFDKYETSTHSILAKWRRPKRKMPKDLTSACELGRNLARRATCAAATTCCFVS